jgi:hypothetical protein
MKSIIKNYINYVTDYQRFQNAKIGMEEMIVSLIVLPVAILFLPLILLQYWLNKPNKTNSVTCTCKIDEEGKLTVDNKCYWHRK